MRRRSRPSPRSNAFQCVFLSLTLTLLAITTVEALPKLNNDTTNGGDEKDAAKTKPAAAASSAKSGKTIFTNINENYQSSSSSLDAMTKKIEEDIKQRQVRMRQYWKRTFEEIREANPVVFPPAGSADERLMHQRRREGEEILERWKQFLDSGGSGTAGKGGGDETPSKSDGASGGGSNAKKIPTPLRFDGFQTWEKQLQQWSDDVSLYLAETESQINELLQPRDPSRYDLSNFGASSSSTQSSKKLTRPGTATAPVGTLPIALTALDKSLPPIPKPRPVVPGEAVVPHTDIADKSKNIWIVTTGALPWMTGTAVNPLLRAAYLSAGRREAGGSVTIVLPWVERAEDQVRVYGGDGARRFETPEDQEEHIRNWLRDTANMGRASEELNIRWYTAWQEVLENSLYSMGDLIGLIPEKDCDICVLEEPEHLNWYRAPGENWTSKFKHVVGIVHTNYFVYATEQPAAFIRAPGMRLLSSWMCRAHCHRLIKLSGTLQQLAPEKELVENVHGVRRTFLDVGEELRTKLTSPGGNTDPVFGADADPTVYFIGKMLWSKGIGSLIDLMKYAEESAGLKVKVDMYGGGPNKDEASAKAVKAGLDMRFHGPIDHAALGGTHKVFVNPSTSEVLCTTVAEALAMGKFVVLPSHPSNDFFAQFPNCLPYTNEEEFVGNLYYALTHAPEPLTEEYSHALSWEAATERFAAAGSVSVAEAEAMEEALSSTEAGIEIDLPPLTASEEQRKKISRTFRRTRGRYRNFRSRLSQEITKSNVLPKELQHRLIAELDKRLDVDLDELLSSPKLRLKLSPAKLDKLLLELYDSVVEGPRGDVFRVIGGGATVGRQNLYVKQQQMLAKLHHHEKGQQLGVDAATSGDEASTPTSLVKRALKRNLPPKW
eukprot:CAMPEP_0172555378 /NCGR_PEP_ID=MMETSP1067-20121228/58384_1 /TAXON_ID=265564 ORGANISM="Thalassiosira punctigera, Strain Tpunct2005C2" /NCGR_SAMPLE_ID=MMETSP1067 /ASSEMBLY_ACC=CAM_ASM_000444 /LENGTH=888 /DNA_ID=CAMNT_0013343895 /DNA_START=172 /DNA_END=2835 /DNA_ORIENTATION=-